MPLLAQVFAAIAAVAHIAFFYLESIAFARPGVWPRFGLSDQHAADTVRPMAFNQGFYNLFLAAGVALGLLLVGTGHGEAGRVLVLFACGSMALAGVVLIATDRRLLRAAALQLVPPGLAIVATLLG